MMKSEKTKFTKKFKKELSKKLYEMAEQNENLIRKMLEEAGVDSSGIRIIDRAKFVVKYMPDVMEELFKKYGASRVLMDDAKIKERLPRDLHEEEKDRVTGFIKGVFKFYSDLGYAYLEINPLIVTKRGLIPVDMVARLDDTAQFLCGKKWGDIEFPAPFGRGLTKEERLIKDMDEKSGASLKLTVLNQKGRVWTIVAGGGASVVYTDTVFDLGFKDELANYGEYSGNPSTDETYQYAKTIIDLMTREIDPRGKLLLIGGGIANFTDVKKTFTGIIKALKEYREKLIDNKVKIYVRRGGPNYQEGLRNMRELGRTLGVPVEVFGPEAHMTSIVPRALKENRG